MTEKEVLRTIRSLYGSILISAAAQFRHRPEVLAGIMCRESEGGLSRHLDRAGPAGRGDSGHGHGLMQIDNRSFPEFCNSDAWPDPDKNIAFGARVLRDKRRYLASKSIGWALSDDDLERAAIAAYNAGEGWIWRAIQAGQDVDTVTAHNSYSREVLRLAEIYRTLGALP